MTTPLHQLASTVGDGTGTTDAIGDYSSTPTVLKIVAPAATVTYLGRVIIHLTDAGSFDADKYGNGITLTNGINVTLRDTDDTLLATLTPEPVISNGDWAGMCHDFSAHTFGTGNNHASIRWTFNKYVPGGIRLLPGQHLDIELEDNYSGLISHHFLFEGYIDDDGTY